MANKQGHLPAYPCSSLAHGPFGNDITDTGARSQGFQQSGDACLQVALMSAHRAAPPVKMNHPVARGYLNLAAVHAVTSHLATYLAAHILIFRLCFVHWYTFIAVKKQKAHWQTCQRAKVTGFILPQTAVCKTQCLAFDKDFGEGTSKTKAAMTSTKILRDACGTAAFFLVTLALCAARLSPLRRPWSCRSARSSWRRAGEGILHLTARAPNCDWGKKGAESAVVSVTPG
jgi:hypothetical protein